MKFNNIGKGRQGFTLIELLVVIAIMAILAALLFPSIAGAIDRAKIAKCMSNLRQIGIAVAGYADSNNQDLPINSPGPSSKHDLWGMDAVGLERALAGQLGCALPANVTRPIGSPIFICPSSSLIWDSSVSRYRARGVVGDHNCYEGLYYNYKLSPVNTGSGDTDANAVPQILKTRWYTNPSGMPFQWCSIRLTMDPLYASIANVLGARSWHGERMRPVLCMAGNVRLLTRPEYTQHANQAIMTAKIAPNINYRASSDSEWTWYYNGGDFSTAASY